MINAKKLLSSFFKLKTLLRLLFIVLVPAVSLNALLIVYGDRMQSTELGAGEAYAKEAYVYTALAAFFALAVVVYEWRFQKEIVRDLVAVIFGTAAGLAVAALAVLMAVAFFLSKGMTQGGVPQALGEAVTQAFYQVQPWIPLIMLGFCYIGITVVLETKGDFRFLIPYIDFSARGTQEGGFILDTSAIIDGRFMGVCEAKVISAPVIIPDYVVREMQALADSKDRNKRLRGRRGLDMVAQIQRSENVRVIIRETDLPEGTPVDDRLVLTAKELHGRIVTTDFNLNKVSQIEGIPVINVNDLAVAVKPRVLPGDQIELTIIKKGQEPGQGVGYLEDGTMVVVEQAADLIGKGVSITITGSIQTSAGRMVFGRPLERESAK